MFKKIIPTLAPMVAVYGFQASANMIFGDISIVLPGSDSVMHFLGGLATAWTGLLLYQAIQKQHAITIAPRAIFNLSLVFFTMTIGVIWEWYEFLHDRLLKSTMQPSLADTMKDLFLDMLGGILFCFLLARRARAKKLKLSEY